MSSPLTYGWIILLGSEQADVIDSGTIVMLTERFSLQTKSDFVQFVPYEFTSRIPGNVFMDALAN